MFEAEPIDIYHGLNPAFVRKVWAKRRREQGRPAAPKPENKGIRRLWTDADKATLLALLDDGFTRAEAAASLGRSYDAVEGVLDRMRKAEHRPVEERR